MTQKKQRTNHLPFLIFITTALFLFSTITPHISQSQEDTDTLILIAGNSPLTSITLEASTQEVHTNTDFFINITVQPGQDIAGIQCTLHYDPSHITVLDVTEGNLFNGYDSYFMPGENDPLSGTLTGFAGVITAPTGYINHTGVFATLHLKTLMTPGTSPLTLTDIILGGPTADSLPFTIINTTITITPEEDSTLLSITPGTQTLFPGKNHTFTIMVTPGTEIAGVQTQLTFDPTYIQILNISQGDLFNATAYFYTSQIDNHNGTIDSISSVTTTMGGTTQAGTLAHITFTTLQKGSTTIHLTQVLIGDPNGTALPYITQPGTLMITASDSAHLSITPSHQDITHGSPITINIHVHPQEYIAGVQLDLTYDPLLLNAQTVIQGTLFQGMDSYFYNGTIDNTQGIIHGIAETVLGATNGTIKNGVFATVTFTAQTTTGQSPLGLTHIILGDSEAQPLFFTHSNASITVLSHYTSISITPQTKFVSPNGTFTLDLQVDPLEAISGVETDITFNPNLITAVSVQEGDLFNGFNTYFQNGTIDNTNGTIQGIWGVIANVGGGSTATPGTFAHITFTAGMTHGTTPITISHALMGTPGGTPVNINIHNGTVAIGTVFTLNFPLKTGWNTLSIPFQDTLTAETLGNRIGVSDAIAKWDPESQGYLIHPVGLTGEDFAIEPGQGYLIHVYEDTQFSITGIPIETTTLALPIKTGWNLLGWIQDTDTTAEQFGETIPGCDTVAIWDPETQDYAIHPQGTPIDDFVIHQGDALFIHTTQNSIWYGQ